MPTHHRHFARLRAPKSFALIILQAGMSDQNKERDQDYGLDVYTRVLPRVQVTPGDTVFLSRADESCVLADVAVIPRAPTERIDERDPDYGLDVYNCPYAPGGPNDPLD
mgnify:CR=1 FL=1